MLWAFVDENREPNLDTAASSVGTHYVLCAVLVADTKLGAARDRAEAVRAKYRQAGGR